MADSPSPTLPCKQCGYVNEPERVYCHNCGSKLDRSLLPKEDEVRRESPDKARQRIKRMTNPGNDIVLREVKTFVYTILRAAVAAALIQIARSPDGVPGDQKDALPPMISSDLADAIDAPTPRALTLTEPEINSFLKTSIKDAKDASWLSSVIQFKRAYVNLTPGVCHIGMEKSLWGYPLYFRTDYKLPIVNGTFTPTNIGGSIGRLAIHPLVMKGADYLFQGLWTALHREEGAMHHMQAIQIDKGRITLTTRGAAKR